MYSRVKFFFFCWVYGEPLIKNRPKLCERFTRASIQRHQQWYVLGDLNEIRHTGENLGGPRRSGKSFQPFNDMINSDYLQEIQLYGNSFTWDGMMATLWIQRKLDRCLGNKNWFHLFPESSQTFLEKRGYDHILIFVKLIASYDCIGQFQVW